MGRVERDVWGNEWIDVTEELRRAQREQRFNRDMGRIGSNLERDLSGGVTRGVVGTAALGVGVAAVGVAAARSLSFRYKLQAVLHFPFAIAVTFIVYSIVVLNLFGVGRSDEEAMVSAMMTGLWLSIGIGIAWSILYIVKRTRPKLRLLGR